MSSYTFAFEERVSLTVRAWCVIVDIVCFVYAIVVQKKEKLQSKFG
jgi:hypothetical protein